MMRTLLFGIFISALSLQGFAQEAMKNPAQNAPVPVTAGNSQITFDKLVHDYGTIEQGADGNVEFRFKNTGKEPLIITNARASCGCTTPIWPKEPIKPGAAGIIKVGYDTKRVGAFTKTITITSNSKEGDAILTIKGVVNAAPPEETFPGKKNDGAVPLEKNN
jgi:hypothetical protein